MAKIRRVKKITAGRYVAVVAYDQILASDTPRARQAKRQHSSRARECLNYKSMWKTLQLLLLCNFSPGDYWVGLDYDEVHLPGRYEDAQAEAKKYIERLRRQVRKLGCELKYVYNTETLCKDGSRRLHHHLLVSSAGGKISAELLESLWTLGGVEIQHLGDDSMYSDDYIEIAQYLTKERFPDAPGRKPGKRGYIASTNLAKPTEESFVVDDTMTITAPPGAKIIDQDHKDNEYGRFDYLLYLLPEMPAAGTPPRRQRQRGATQK